MPRVGAPVLVLVTVMHGCGPRPAEDPRTVAYRACQAGVREHLRDHSAVFPPFSHFAVRPMDDAPSRDFRVTVFFDATNGYGQTVRLGVVCAVSDGEVERLTLGLQSWDCATQDCSPLRPESAHDP